MCAYEISLNCYFVSLHSSSLTLGSCLWRGYFVVFPSDTSIPLTIIFSSRRSCTSGWLFGDPLRNLLFSKQCLSTNVVKIWEGFNFSPLKRVANVSQRLCSHVAVAFWTDYVQWVGGEQQPVRSTKHQPDRHVNELWMCVTNDQSVILIVCPPLKF